MGRTADSRASRVLRVSPALTNANPGSVVSWADFFLNFGPWVDPVASGARSLLPLHLSTFKRAALLESGPRLERLLEVEGVLSWDLTARRHQLYLEPSALISHLNVTALPSFLRFQFHGGRAFGAVRAGYRRWSRLRRLFYAVAAPAILLIRLWRVLREMHRAKRLPGLLPGVLPPLLVGLTMHGLGETIGYLAGPGGAVLRKSAMEFDRPRHAAAGSSPPAR